MLEKLANSKPFSDSYMTKKLIFSVLVLGKEPEGEQQLVPICD